MIKRVSRTRSAAGSAEQTLRRDPRAKTVAAEAQAVVEAKGSVAVTPSKLPRIDVHAEAKFRLRREVRVPSAAPVASSVSEAKAERLDPRAKRSGRVRSDATTSTAAPSETAARRQRDNIVRIENPAEHIFVVSIGADAWSDSEREMLGGARQIADGLADTAVTLLRIGVSQPACDAGAAGADRVWNAGESSASPESAATHVIEAISHLAPRHLLFADSSVSGDIARRVAVELGERPAVGLQKLTADTAVSRGNGGRSDFTRTAPRILLVTPGLFDPLEGTAPREARRISIDASTALDTRIRNLGPEDLSVANVPLSEADFIVSAGDGITDWPAFFDVADALSGVVGGSRQVCDAGLLPRHRQVGASGTLVEAKAYLALGISGAPQHLQGIQRCRFVAAVNTDLHAAMVKRADIAIIADAQLVMPELASIAREKRHAR